MTTETQLLTQAKRYFEKLGYPPDSIMLEQRKDDYSRTDLEIQLNGATFLVLEMKGSKAFNFDTVEDIKYHPAVRRLQKEARESKASYFVLYDGNKFSWFKTGDDGRPELVNSVKFAESNSLLADRDLHLFNNINFVVKTLSKYRSQQEAYYILSLLLYASLTQNDPLKSDIDFDSEFQFLRRPYYVYDLSNEQREILDCLTVINAFDLNDYKDALTKFIREALAKANSYTVELPSWLPDFMVSASGGKNTDIAYDLFSRRGVVTLSLYSKGVDSVRTIYSDKNDTYWIHIIQILYQGKPTPLHPTRNILEDLSRSYNLDEAGQVFICPPFNSRIENEEFSFREVKDVASLSILLALQNAKFGAKIVAVVPDSLLISSAHLRFRHYLLSLSHVEAIISLPNNSFIPFASIKTSVIVLSKGHNEQRGAFMAFMVNEKKSAVPSNMEQVLASLSLHYNGGIPDTSLSGFVVNQIYADNLHVSKYWVAFAESKDINAIQKGYFSIPLKELAISIKKGHPVNIDEEYGEIPLLGPASIRRLDLLHDKVSYTSEGKIPKGANRIEEGDIVINTISSHRGEAALVVKEFSGMLINKHVISVKPNLALVNPDYLAIAFNSGVVKNQLLINTSGSVIEFITLRNVEDVLIPVPSFEEQERIVSDYAALASQVHDVQKQLHDLQLQINEMSNQLGKEIII